MYCYNRLPFEVANAPAIFQQTIAVLTNLFASYGLPEQIVSDNGPQFTSAEFSDFMRLNGVKHIRTVPYHPSSNGEAERFVQTFKHALKARKNDKGTLHQKLTRFLLKYRSTPHSTTGVSPAELFLKRRLRTRLNLLRPSLEKRVATRRAKQKSYHDAHSKEREFMVGEMVPYFTAEAPTSNKRPPPILAKKSCVGLIALELAPTVNYWFKS